VSETIARHDPDLHKEVALFRYGLIADLALEPEHTLGCTCGSQKRPRRTTRFPEHSVAALPSKPYAAGSAPIAAAGSARCSRVSTRTSAAPVRSRPPS